MTKKHHGAFFSAIYQRGLYTGDGFRVRFGFGKYGLLFRIYWGPYKDSRLLILFVGIDHQKLLDWRIKRVMRKTTQEQRLAISNALLELTREDGKGY